jgi:trehalose 6-phosphate phosphatase
MQADKYDAAILDMDGVITQTATLHAQAWKRMFDAYLAQRGKQEGRSYEPFDSAADYRQYVDGKPRYDGVRSFLRARGIDLPEGDSSDAPERETICGLGNRKNELFHEVMRQEGVAVYDDAVEQIGNWHRQGLKVAVISSSRNCTEILHTAGVLELFDAKVDGHDSERLRLRGKPAPDIFLRAAEALGVVPARAIVVEDAIAGVQAGRAGGFGLVVGVARSHAAEDLRQHGADVVVHDLRQLTPHPEKEKARPTSSGQPRTPSSALEHFDRIVSRLARHELALFLDYDGTLTPIVDRPEQATLSDAMRTLLRRLAEHCTLAIVSGRDRQDVQRMVQLDNLIYAGSHGFDISGPGGLHLQHDEAQQSLPDLESAEQELQNRLADVEGVLIERKRFAIAVHSRLVADADLGRIEDAVEAVRKQHTSLRRMDGKKVVELQPDVAWDKGQAVLWLRQALGMDRPEVVTIYIGDDVTDEDAFRAIAYHGLGLGIIVAPPTSGTAAHYYLRDCDAVQQFLGALLERLPHRSH